MKGGNTTMVRTENINGNTVVVGGEILLGGGEAEFIKEVVAPIRKKYSKLICKTADLDI